MKGVILSVAKRLKKSSPATITAAGVLYAIVLGLLDYYTPTEMSFTLFYLMGVAFVGWGAGARAAVLLSAVSAAIMGAYDWTLAQTNPVSTSVWLWNASTRFLLFYAAGWLTAEVTRLNRNLLAMVEARLAQLQAETEKHKATSARLGEALLRFDAILATAMDGFAEIDASGRICDVNDAYCQLLGYSRAELLAKQLTEIDATQSVAEISRRVGAVREKRGGRFETRYHHKDGHEVDVEVSVSWPAGDSDPLIIFARDITDRKRAEFMLRAQRDVGASLSLTSDLPTALNSLLNIGLELEGIDCGGVYLADATTGDLNLAASCGGCSVEFLQHVACYPANSDRTRSIKKGEPIYELYEDLPDWQDEVRDREGLKAVSILPLQHEGTVFGALIFSSHTHASIPIQTRMVMEALASQTAGAIARIRAETALRQSQARLRTIIAGVPIVVFAVDRHGVITFEDGRALNALGVEPGKQVGQTMQAAYGQSADILEHMQRALGGEEFSATVQIGPVILETWYSPTRETDGSVSGYTGVAVNVTDRHRLERQILEISDREQARIGQEIHDGLCQHLVSLAFDANALHRELSAQHRSEARTATRLADYLDQAITEARQLSRGLFPIRLDAESLRSALEELARTTSERFRIQCIFESGATAAVDSKAIATHLYRIAQEAVSNAVKHGQARSIHIRLEVLSDQLQLQVEDDGVGLVAAKPPRLTGMGLHIMDYRARSVGGTLAVGPGGRGGTVVSCRVPGHLD